MKKLLGKSMLGLGFCFTGSNVFAQTAVEINYKEALQEFKEENYSKSIKLLENAVGLNDKDPSLWLLLGKSYYQTGDLDQAIKSFEKTVLLAPNEKYAKAMLAKLVKNSGSAEQRLNLIKELIDKEYYTLAAAESTLLNSLILTEKQKGLLLFEKTRIAMGVNNFHEAILNIEKLKNDHKDFATPHKIKLIEASINLKSQNRDKIELALVALDELSGHEDKKTSSHAALLILKFNLKEKVSLKNVSALNDWFNANKESEFYLETCRTLIDLNKSLNTQLPGQSISKEDKRIFELLEVYLKEEVIAQKRMALSRDLLKYFSARYKKSGPSKEFIPIIDKLLGQLADKEGSYEVLGRHQLGLLTYFAETEVAEQRKIGTFQVGAANELTKEFIKLITSLLDKGLLKESEAIVFTENHLDKVTDGNDFKLRDEIWATVKSKVNAQNALLIDLEMLNQRADYHVDVLVKEIKQGSQVPEKLPKVVTDEFSRWLTLFNKIDSKSHNSQLESWRLRFNRLFNAGAHKAIVDITNDVQIENLSAKRFFALYNASLKARIALTNLRMIPLKDAEALKAIPEEISSAIASYTAVINAFGKGDAISTSSQSLFSLINDLANKNLHSFAAIEYGKAETLFSGLNTEKGKELAAAAAYFKEKSLFNKTYLEFSRNIQAKKEVSLDDALKNVFAAHEAYLTKYAQSPHRLAIADHFYKIALDFIALKQWDDASAVLKLISESSVNPAQKERDLYLSLTAKAANALPSFGITEINSYLRPPVKKLRAKAKPQQQQLQFIQNLQFQVPILTEKAKASRKELFKQLIPELQKIISQGKNESIKSKSSELILKMAVSWNSYSEWKEAVAIYRKYLNDNPGKVSSRAYIRKSIVQALKNNLNKSVGTKQWKERVNDLDADLKLLREEYSSMSKDVLLGTAQRATAAWELTQTYLIEARYIQNIKKSLSRSRYLRYSRELNKFVRNNFKNSYRSRVPASLKSLGDEMVNLGFYQEAINVYQLLYSNYPGHGESHAAGLQMAQVYRNYLKQPIKAAEVYLEMNYTFANGHTLQNEIFNMASQLKNEKRWIESLHIFEVFTASFPKHPTAGHAMEMIGEIHQANESWDEAINAYNKVIAHCNSGSWIKEARWAIADCYIQLSKWSDALKAYREYDKEYHKDSRKSELTRRIAILKDLSRYQMLVDEEGQRKSFDAQYQIATIVRDRLNLNKKAAKEYMKVYENWPKAHLADDALYQRGVSLMAVDLIDQARDSWNLLGEKYAGSPLADDALYLVGKSYEDESIRLARVDRGDVLRYNKARVQNEAYLSYYGGRAGNRKTQKKRLMEAQKNDSARDADILQASNINQQWAFDNAYVTNTLQSASRQVEAYTASQLADQQDKVNAALRKAIASYNAASAIASADKAGEALLRMAGIYDEKLNNSEKAMEVWKETVRQFSGTSVAEDASWKIARYYEHNGNFKEAIDADKSFLRNYRRSAKAELAQFAIAEHFEHLSDWVSAMDAYTNYIKNYPKGQHLSKAKEQINWIKTYRL